MPDVTVKDVKDEKVPASSADGTGSGTAKEAAKPTSYRFGGKEYGSVDDLGKAYESLQSEHGKWTQQYGDLKKQYDEASKTAQQWGEWWKAVQPLWGDDVEGLLRQKLTGKQTPQPTKAPEQPTATGFEGFELLRPEEQAAKIQQAVTSQLARALQQQWEQYNQALNKAITEKEQWYQSYLSNHLSLMRKALERKIQDPKFDVDSVMEQAAKAIGGQMDPIELGQQLLAAAQYQAQLEAAKKESYEQGKKDYEQEQANKKIETVPPSTGAPIYKPPALASGAGSTRHGLTSIRQRAAEDLVKKFGTTIFSGE